METIIEQEINVGFLTKGLERRLVMKFVEVLAGGVVLVGLLGGTYLITKTQVDSIRTDIVEIKADVRQNRDLILQLVSREISSVAFPAPKDKLVGIPKSQLLLSSIDEEILSVGPRDYKVILIEYDPAEQLAIEWQVLTPKNGSVRFYIYNSQGTLETFAFQNASFSGLLEGKTADKYYLYFDNTFDPSNSKLLGVRLASVR